jgi:hypothetical protein
MTDAQPDDSYPSSWRPPGSPPFSDEVDPTEAELWLGTLSATEFAQVLHRVREGNR